ncbi:hypothetical protein J23TS9_14830 [Paenibacillus sp. J23TS9]|uniref:hypothetical protein n=1 Tax=Paenibacillus sp. J23TS9 TaxID=2807193 RepID=UPI001B0A349C|nr:hypothetical protein [Paenibacillus sp. J23TS9]GIP26353.1 hypothetical protein J23TS9_14830 [Paenibacillus sp. J23TS9]
MIKFGKTWRSVTIGLLFAVFALGLLPFLIIYSLTEHYGMPDLYDWIGVPPLQIFSRMKKQPPDRNNDHPEQ